MVCIWEFIASSSNHNVAVLEYSTNCRLLLIHSFTYRISMNGFEGMYNNYYYEVGDDANYCKQTLAKKTHLKRTRPKVRVNLTCAHLLAL